MHYFRLKSLIATAVIMVRRNIEGNARLPVFEGSEVRPLMDWGVYGLCVDWGAGDIFVLY